MKRFHIALLSAIICLAYGIFDQKLLFISLGVTFILIALADYLKQKKKKR